MLPGFIRRSVAVLVRGAVLGFYLSQVGCVFFFVFGVFLSLIVGCGGGGEDVREQVRPYRGIQVTVMQGLLILCIMEKVRLESWDLASMSIPSMCPSPSP